MCRRTPISTLALLAAVAAACGPKPAPVAPPTTPPPVADITPAAGPDDKPLPLWPKIKQGQLPNGLRYFILPHKQPQKPGKLIARMTVENVKAAARRYTDPRQFYQAVMMPAENAPPPAAK